MNLLTPGDTCRHDGCLGKIQFDDGSLMNEGTRIPVIVESEPVECFIYQPPPLRALQSRDGVFCQMRRKFICEMSCFKGNQILEIQDKENSSRILTSAPERVPIPQGSNQPVYNEEETLLNTLKPDVSKTCRDQCMDSCPNGQKCTWSITKGYRTIF